MPCLVCFVVGICIRWRSRKVVDDRCWLRLRLLLTPRSKLGESIDTTRQLGDPLIPLGKRCLGSSCPLRLFSQPTGRDLASAILTVLGSDSCFVVVTLIGYFAFEVTRVGAVVFVSVVVLTFIFAFVLVAGGGLRVADVVLAFEVIPHLFERTIAVEFEGIIVHRRIDNFLLGGGNGSVDDRIVVSSSS